MHNALQSDFHSSNFSIFVLRMDKTKGNFIIIFMHAIGKETKQNKTKQKNKKQNKREQL